LKAWLQASGFGLQLARLDVNLSARNVCWFSEWNNKLKDLVSETNTKTGTGRVRRFPRYQFDAKIKAHAFRDGETLDVWGRSTELGLDGIGGTLTGELEPGDVVTIELPLPLSPYPLKLRAIVRYRQGLRHGFEFLAISQADRDALARVCEMLEGTQ
jgi:hypothetical protein